MKKYLIILLTLVFVLASCSSNEEEATGEKDSSKSEGPVTISFIQPGLEKPQTKKAIEKTVKRFEEENPDIKVDVQGVGWKQAYQKLVTGFQSGESPDVIYGGTRWMPAFQAMEAIKPLNEFAEEKIKEYPESLRSSGKIGDEIYAIPRSFSSRTLYYRSDLIEEPPKTWDELVKKAKQVQKENEGMFGFGISGASGAVSTTTQYFNYVVQNGGEVFDKEGNVQINSPEAVEALEFYRDLYTKHKITPNPLEYTREQLPILFKEGKLAMFVNGPWARGIMEIEQDDEDTPFKVAKLPKGEQMGNILVSDSLMMSADTEHPEAAWKFIEHLTSLEEQKKYDKNEGLVPILSEESEDPYFKEDPFFSKFVEMVEYGHEQPKVTAWEPFQDIVIEAVQKSLQGEDPQKLLDNAAKEIKKQNLEPKQ
ncbi:MAG TPA: sugar ABC transporter substrate-binding protein [Lentibacillus sp.]|uniref:ABC transporter substrate-binding protein n=1 Tax=Lentibacillus sp. TaxID=1925746 RepID=UPI002B4B2E43|nr:sugar ABC transporter substrate-binding protein [Lentibacillus sp.]HLR62142.1 sugar ABC transporter substrate-binding protein [Lentibacillus sp.]